MAKKKRKKGGASVGEAARRKGRNGELEAARRLEGERTSQTGLASPDVTDKHGNGWEVKRRSKEFKKLYEYLDQTDGVDRLFIRDDRMPWLVVLQFEQYQEDVGWNDEENGVDCSCVGCRGRTL